MLKRCRGCGCPRFLHFLVGGDFIDDAWILKDWDRTVVRIERRRGWDFNANAPRR